MSRLYVSLEPDPHRVARLVEALIGERFTDCEIALYPALGCPSDTLPDGRTGLGTAVASPERWVEARGGSIRSDDAMTPSAADGLVETLLELGLTPASPGRRGARTEPEEVVVSVRCDAEGSLDRALAALRRAGAARGCPARAQGVEGEWA